MRRLVSHTVRQLSGLRSLRNTKSAVTDHASEGFSQHTRSVTVVQVCRTALTSVERVIDFSIFDLGGLPLGPRSPKGEMTYYPPSSTILQKFSPIAQTVYEICVTKVSVFGLGGTNPWAKVHQKGRRPISTILQNFSPIA